MDLGEAVIGAVVSAAGIYGIWYSFRDLARARASVDWHLVNATIISAGVREHGRKGRSYEPEVLYQYSFANQVYTGNRIVFSWFSTRSRKDAETFVNRFPAGLRLEVRVSPTDPRISVMNAGVYRQNWFSVWLAVALTAAGVVALWAAVQ